MIEFYLFSIIVWFLMIFGSIYLFKSKIIENGWLEGSKPVKNGSLITVFLACAIPFVRAFYFLSVIIMAGMTKEQFEEWTKELK